MIVSDTIISLVLRPFFYQITLFVRILFGVLYFWRISLGFCNVLSIVALNFCSFIVINYWLIFVYAFTQNVCAFGTNKQIIESIAEFRDLLLIQEHLIYTSNAIWHKIFIFSVHSWTTGILEPVVPVLFWDVETSQQADFCNDLYRLF